MSDRRIIRALFGYNEEEAIRWEINQLEVAIDDHESYCDALGLPYDDAMEKARLAKLREELKKIKG